MYCTVDNAKLTPFQRHVVLVKEGLVIFISWFVLPTKLIRGEYLNFPKSHKFENFSLIAEAEKTIHKNSSVSNVYKFSHVYFQGIEFYAIRQYENF